MGKLIYSMLMSLVQDEQGRFGWGAPEDQEAHSHINQLASSVGTYLYGRRMYEKIVYSRTLAEPRTVRTRIEREFDPRVVRGLKADVRHDITVDGPELAVHALWAGLVDELQMIVCPVVRLKLELVNERRFRHRRGFSAVHRPWLRTDLLVPGTHA